MKKEKIEKNEKINIYDLLRYCPKGMPLDSPCFDELKFTEIRGKTRIICHAGTGSNKYKAIFNQYGCVSNSPTAKCVIFPKGKTTWEGFIPTFKDGDVVTWSDGKKDFIFIWKDVEDKDYFSCYCGVVYQTGQFVYNYDCKVEKSSDQHPSTEEETQRLFEAIKLNGFEWDSVTKTLKEDSVNSYILNELTARLPYGLKMYGIGCGIQTLKGIRFDDLTGWGVEVENVRGDRSNFDLKDLKPLLYPISSMTEDQLKELTHLVLARRDYYSKIKEIKWKSFEFKHNYWEVSLQLIRERVTKKEDSGIDSDRVTNLVIALGDRASNISHHVTPDEVSWFNKHHIDYKGMIDKKLAVNLTGLEDAAQITFFDKQLY